MTAIEPSTSEAKCSASAASAWLLVSSAVRCNAPPRQKFTAMATRNLAAARPAVAKAESAATRDLRVWAGSLMGGGLAARPLTSSADLRRNRHSLREPFEQARFVANYSELREQATFKCDSAVSRHGVSEVFQNLSPKVKRAQGMPGARCTRGLVRKNVERAHTSIQVQTGASRHSLRNGFTAYIRLSPENRACFPPSPSAQG